MPLTDEDIVNRVSYHPPNEERRILHEDVRTYFFDMMHRMNGLLPDSREKSIVFTELETAMFWANASIARNVK